MQDLPLLIELGVASCLAILAELIPEAFDLQRVELVNRRSEDDFLWLRLKVKHQTNDSPVPCLVLF